MSRVITVIISKSAHAVHTRPRLAGMVYRASLSALARLDIAAGTQSSIKGSHEAQRSEDRFQKQRKEKQKQKPRETL